MSYSGKTTSGQLGTGGDNEIAADSGTAANLQGGKNLTVTGGEGVDTTIANSSGNITVTVAAEDSTAANKGVVIVAGGTGATVGYSSGTATVNVDAAQTQITSVGTIGTGVWNGTAIASAYLDADTAHLTTTQTFSGAKSFTGGVTIDEGELTLGSTALSSTAAELNVLDGLNRGHIIVGNASNAPTSLAEGSEDQVLTIDSNGDAVWAAAAGGSSTGWHVESDASSSNGSAFSPASDTVVVMCVTASGARYVQLPAVSGNTDRIFVVKDKSNNAGANNITVLSNSSEEIEGSTADYVISTSGASVTFITDGSKWYII